MLIRYIDYGIVLCIEEWVIIVITFKEFLYEKRRNPVLNPKKSVLKQLREIYVEYPNAYITFTSIAKVGINPQSKWQTPLGIYGYPLGYVIKKNLKVPYAGTSPYITIFDYNGNYLVIAGSVLNFGERGNMEDVYEKTQKDVRGAYLKIQKGIKEVLGLGGEISLSSDNLSMKGIWKVMYDSISKYLGDGEEYRSFNDNEKYKMLTRKILIAAGYDGVLDHGLGVIHKNEPTQGVFFFRSKLSIIRMIDNRADDTEYSGEGTLYPIESREEWFSRVYRAIRLQRRDRDVERLVGKYYDSHLSSDGSAGGMSILIKYAIMAAKGRIPSFEPYILKSGIEDAISYVSRVIKGRWPELEEQIKGHPKQQEYYNNTIEYLS